MWDEAASLNLPAVSALRSENQLESRVRNAYNVYRQQVYGSFASNAITFMFSMGDESGRKPPQSLKEEVVVADPLSGFRLVRRAR